MASAGDASDMEGIPDTQEEVHTSWVDTAWRASLEHHEVVGKAHHKNLAPSDKVQQLGAEDLLMSFCNTIDLFSGVQSCHHGKKMGLLSHLLYCLEKRRGLLPLQLSALAYLATTVA